MARNTTFSLIKPPAVAAQHVGGIIHLIEEAGFQLNALQLTQLTLAQAKEFYAVHQGRPFYNSICSALAAGPVVAMVLEKEKAVTAFRTLLGATDPAQAAPHTLRKRFGISMENNAVHGADAEESAAVEIKLLFPSL